MSRRRRCPAHAAEVSIVKPFLGWTSSLRRQSGQGLTEYALILGLIAVVVVGALTFLSGAIEGTFNTISNTL
jgi:pilus assembly protein Flp/PilA